MAVAAQAGGQTVTVTIKRKTFKIAQNEVQKAKDALAASWRPTLRAYNGQLTYVQEMWSTHNKMREESYFTARIIAAAGFTTFPPKSIVDNAHKAYDTLARAVASKDPAAIHAAHMPAFQAIYGAAKQLDAYTKAMTGSGENCVKALEFTRDAAADIVEITAELIMLGKPGGAQIAAGGAGAYKELLHQIEEAQGPDKFSAVTAGAMIVGAGAREALLKVLMKDGGFSKHMIEKATEKFGKTLLKHVGKETTKKFFEKLFEKGLEESIVATLREFTKAAFEQKLDLKDLAWHVAEEVGKKVGLTGALAGMEKPLGKMGDTLLKKIKDGAIKGAKIEGPAAEKAFRETVEKMAEKSIEKYLLLAGSNLSLLSKLPDQVMADILADSAFKAQVQKLSKKK